MLVTRLRTVIEKARPNEAIHQPTAVVVHDLAQKLPAKPKMKKAVLACAMTLSLATA